MAISGTLQRKLDLFRCSERIFRENQVLFAESSLLQVLLGQVAMPKRHHSMVDLMSAQEIPQWVANVKDLLDCSADAMPTHEDFIANNCSAERAKVKSI